MLRARIAVLSVILLGSASTARAQSTGTATAAPSTGTATPSTGTAAPSTGTPAPAADAKPAEGEKKKEEERWEVTGDVVLGQTRFDVFGPGRIAAPGQPGISDRPNGNSFDRTKVSSFSIIPGLQYHLSPRFWLRGRLPVVVGELDSVNNTAESRTATNLGNVDLGGTYALIPGEDFQLEGGFDLALPTAGGSEGPSAADAAKNPTGRYEYRAIDRFAVSRAADVVRGSAESGALEPGRLGLVPRISARIQFGRLMLRPTIKVENMIDVTGDSAHTYVGEIVAGVRAGVRVASFLEPGVNVWTNATILQQDNRKRNMGVVEPYIRFPNKAVTPTLGVVIPFAGQVADDSTLAFRLGILWEI
jgi:hypothetical protein